MTTPSYTLYTAGTPNGFKASIMLEELGVPFEVRAMAISKNAQKEEWFTKINPNGRIPALVDHSNNDHAVFESGAILWYLAEKHGKEAGLWPEDFSQRSEIMQWLLFQMGGVGPMQGQANHFLRYAPVKIDYGISRFHQEVLRLYKVLDRQLAKQQWLAGDAYSIADIANFAWVAGHFWAGVRLDLFPHVKEWMQRIAQRPSVRKGLEIPEAGDIGKALDDPSLVETHLQEAEHIMASARHSH